MEKTSVLVLIAEDEAEIRNLLQDTFEDGGFDVYLVSTGEEAIAALDEQGDNLRAVVSDINLGGKATGWDVARHARQLKADMPVVYMTGTEGSDWAALGVPNSILITKPFAPTQVLTAVSQLLNAANTAAPPAPGD
ncbi:response regulator [Reyranella sp. MMS21-HV4-11]|jgi:CheY-like chemotaxis protein|uniref:Response regulator n=1 Tax=Reyranella humidisoli TaxID=2849149 RepID=A0ABS6IL64_9HYPH|nr:response regulator [Reyranella sp. MMS21-HV4-11]MBU8874654.1 response regulator [Reyranella sp. MMS21-HV4-11]